MRFGQEVQTLPRNALLNAETALRAATPRDEALKALSTMLSEAGVESSAAEARLLLCAASGLNGLDLIREPERSIGAATLERLWPMARRRAAREPLSRILSQREFWGLPIAISPDVLDPRSDTETLVEAVVREFAPERHAPLRILDLGSGSGAILCALLKEFDKATAVGVDLSPAAAALSRSQSRNLWLCRAFLRHGRVVGKRASRSIRRDRLQSALHSQGGNRRPGARGSGPRPSAGARRRPRRAGRLSGDWP